MPYNILRSEVSGRFLEVNHLLNNIKNLEDAIIPPTPAPIEYKIFKGFFYVHIYAAIEFSFHQIVLNTLALIKAKQVINQHFDNRFYTIALSSNLHAIRDGSSKTFLVKSADLFLSVDSLNISNFDETMVSQYLQNIWGKSFNQVTKTIGINNFPISGREIFVFDEIVDNRNKLAHGRYTAESIGSAPNYQDLKDKYDLIFDTINRYINHVENYYTNKEFVKVMQRPNY